MNKKNYPTKIHEILELEPNEQFGTTISGLKGDIYYFNEDAYLLNADSKNIVDGYWIVCLINEQKSIIRNPYLNESQINIFKGLISIGYKWMAKDEDAETYHAYVSRPSVHTCNGGYFSYLNGEADVSHLAPILKSMFSPSGLSDPISIIKALEDNRKGG